MEDKKELRKKILNMRNKMSREDVEKNSRIIMDKLVSLDLYKKSKLIFIYMDFKNEVMTLSLIEKMLKEGKRVALPFTDTINTALIPSKIVNERDDLILNPFGYYEPKNIKPVSIEEIDLVIVPGVIFDESLNRIGYGKGYYDRILKELKPDAKKLALAHDFQVLELIPTEDHDIKMDMVISEKAIYKEG